MADQLLQGSHKDRAVTVKRRKRLRPLLGDVHQQRTVEFHVPAERHRDARLRGDAA